MTEQGHVTVEEAAVLCKVSRRSLYYWMKWGHLRYELRKGSRWFALADVEALITRERKTFRLNGAA